MQVALAASYWSSTDWCFESLMSELPPMAMTAIFFVMWSLSCPGLFHRQSHDGLLRVQAVLGLVEHDRFRPVHDLAGDLHVAVGGQRVHVDGVVLCQLHLAGIGDPV